METEHNVLRHRSVFAAALPLSLVLSMPLSLVPSLPLSLVLSLPLSCLSRCLSRTKGDDSKAEKGAFFEEKVNEVGVFLVSETQATGKSE